MEHQASKFAVQHLLSTPANRSQRRLVYVIGALICLLSLFAVPFARIQLAELPAYQPAIFSTVICFELITAYVLYSQFRINRLPSVLSLAAGYLFSGGMSTMYLLTFPGIFSKTGLFHAGLQTAPSLYLIWHLGLPTAIFGYVWFESRHRGKQLSPARARTLSVLVTTAVLLLIAGCTVLTTKFHDSVPALLKDGHLTSLFIYYISVPIIIYSVIALVLFFRLSRGNTVTTAWLCIALLASLLDVCIVICGGGRFSLGWYVAKWNTFMCANAVLCGMIYEFTKMYMSLTVLYRKAAESEKRYKDLLGESRLAEREISKRNEIIARMLESSQEAIVMCDVEGRVVFANRRFEQLFERPLLNGQLLADYCERMKTSHATMAELIHQYFAGHMKPFRERISMVTGKEKTRYFESYVSPLTDEVNGQLHGHLFGFHDRTDEVRIMYYDELTGLPNRRYLGVRLIEALDRAKQRIANFSVFFMDLDGFKKVNDTFGHEMGDRLLQEVSSLLQLCVGSSGVCARWAGDEFIVLLEDIQNRDQLEALAEQINHAVEQLREIDGIAIHVTASIGVAIYPNDGSEGKMLLMHADQAMYEAKLKGKNTCCFYSAADHEHDHEQERV